MLFSQLIFTFLGVLLKFRGKKEKSRSFPLWSLQMVELLVVLYKFKALSTKFETILVIFSSFIAFAETR